MIFSSLSYLRDSTKDQSLWIVPDRHCQDPAIPDVGRRVVILSVASSRVHFHRGDWVGLAR
jgi:hypothetical protein